MTLNKFVCVLVFHLVHSESIQPVCKHKITSNLVTLTLYNDRNQAGKPLKCDYKSFQSLTNSANVLRPTKVVMHGFKSSREKMLDLGWRDVRKTGKYGENLIIVDWSQLADPSKSKDFSFYRTAAACAIKVGRYLGRCLVKMNVSGRKLHLFGHSLGAHGVGAAGRQMKKKFFPARVTGMDPAGPCFSHTFKSAVPMGFGVPGLLSPASYCSKVIPKIKKIGKDSGKYVDIVHSNPGVWGTAEKLGHVDYFVNEGISKHPECGSDLNNKQAHTYAVKIVVEALKEKSKREEQYTYKCDLKPEEKPICKEQWITKQRDFDLKKEFRGESTYSLHTNAECCKDCEPPEEKWWMRG